MISTVQFLGGFLASGEDLKYNNRSSRRDSVGLFDPCLCLFLSCIYQIRCHTSSEDERQQEKRRVNSVNIQENRLLKICSGGFQ